MCPPKKISSCLLITDDNVTQFESSYTEEQVDHKSITKSIHNYFKINYLLIIYSGQLLQRARRLKTQHRRRVRRLLLALIGTARPFLWCSFGCRFCVSLPCACVYSGDGERGGHDHCIFHYRHITVRREREWRSLLAACTRTRLDLTFVICPTLHTEITTAECRTGAIGGGASSGES
jgi:hypothetical protein